MLRKKLLLRRLACVPWLLVVGLVLGWSGEGGADGGAGAHGGSGVVGHTHATDPYLRVSYKLSTDTDAATADSVFVDWSTSYSKNFSANNGAAAVSYTLDLVKGEIPAAADINDAKKVSLKSGNDSPYSASGGDDLDVRSATFIVDLEADTTGPDFYWVRMMVEVTDGEGGGSPVTSYFTKQIAVEPDYTLSVSPTSVREDADPTNITVKVTVDQAVTVDTSVPLRFGENQQGLNTRFRMVPPTLTIPNGKKEATGTIRFIPVESTTTPDDDILVRLVTQVGGTTVEGGTDIRLVDADKGSNFVNLSFSPADLNKRDPATDIVVTATLDGKPLDETVSFILTIDKGYESNPTAAERDKHYTARMATITIRRNRISGRATINIDPLNLDEITDTRSLRVIASGGKVTINRGTAATTDDRDITINGALIDITGDPSREITGLTATPFSIREDAGSKEVKLEVSLKNPLATDETVLFSFDDEISADFSDQDVTVAERDNHYHVRVQSLTIPKGETKGTTTMTVTVANDNEENKARAFTVVAEIGGATLPAGILITDDDSTSESITLEASPVEISESSGLTQVTVRGILHGKAFADDIDVSLIIDTAPKDTAADGSEVDVAAAVRDLDYVASLSPLRIPGGSTTGTTTITINPTQDTNAKEGDETIRLTGLGKPKATDEDGEEVDLTVNHVDITLKDADATAPQPEPQDPTKPTFAAADAVDDQVYTVGTAIDPLVLPEAAGADTPFMYNVFSLGMPIGLTFDPATRTLSGTPTAATDGPVTIIYTVIDSDRDAATPLTFSITVNAAEVPPPVADAEIMATPSLIREDAGETQVSLIVSLMAAKDTAERITFTIVDPSEGKAAVRDVDYDATLGAVVTIPAGSTVGTTTLTLAPVNNTKADGLRALGVQATFSSGATLVQNIEIADDETPSTSVELSVSPNAINEKSAETTVTVTATLNGEALAEVVSVILSIDAASTASRDVDYAAELNPLIQIPANSITGSTQLTITPIDDDLREGTEIIKLTSMVINNGLTGDEVEIMLADQAEPEEPEEPEDPEDSSLGFAADTVIPDQRYTDGAAIKPLVLPAASGGTGALTYRLVGLPAGLSFDSATRTLSGTPTAATSGAVEVSYIVTDEGGSIDFLTFSITVNPGLSFSDLFGAGKVVPTASHDLAKIREFVVGQRVENFALPEGTGGTAPLTYTLSPALPAGLTFDAATRTIAGTPRAESEAVYTYTVADANGATATLSLQTLPTAFSLADNFPNPFNPATTIQYALPQAADVELTVYNAVGQPVRTLVAEHQSAGRYMVEWDATNDSGHSLSSGMYFYRLQVGEEFHEVKKMLLLK